MTVIPLFPPGVHDLIVEEIDDDVVRLSCSEGDWVTVETRAEGVPWVRASHSDHARKHRRPCHVACYDDDGHTDGCLYDGDEG